MEQVISIQALADLKRLPATKLRGFGLMQNERGVVFTYQLPDGRPARPRLRSALRGANGTSWIESDELPITVYTRPSHQRPVNAAELIVVEGESDCWIAWLHDYNAIGIPGSDSVAALSRAHVEGSEVVFIQRERVEGPNGTYPFGVDQFVSDVSDRFSELGFDGDIRILEMPEGFQDLGDLYVDDPSLFPTRFRKALDAARMP
tara:strand:- start:6481 stop:7092 length:612 start_codon:yes stop_codon:yes gene_type:complete